jgi:hypothetical protein
VRLKILGNIWMEIRDVGVAAWACGEKYAELQADRFWSHGFACRMRLKASDAARHIVSV